MPSVLIVDDLLSIHEMLDAVIQPTGFATAFATDGEKALALYKADKYDLVLADIDMKPMDGITLLKHLKAYDPSCVIIIMTAYASTESAVQALKFGAFDYLQKPFRVDELIATLKRGVEFKQFQAEQQNAATQHPAATGDIETRIIGTSAPIKKLSTVRTPVLLQGEIGTGKTTAAEVLHANGAKEDAPFIRIDCTLSTEASFREGLLGQGGTGGSWVQQAKGGTLFLQHLQSLALPMQRELVSVLRNTAQGFRLICTADVDLEKLTDEGKFHDELFYRVASLPVMLPALRNRREDIPLLVKHYLSQATNPLFEANLIEFSDAAMAILSTYSWPGNLPELAQIVSQIAGATETRIVEEQQIPLRLRDAKSWPSLKDHLAAQEKEYIECVLHACRGDKTKAAGILGVDVGSLGS